MGLWIYIYSCEPHRDKAYLVSTVKILVVLNEVVMIPKKPARSQRPSRFNTILQNYLTFYYCL